MTTIANNSTERFTDGWIDAEDGKPRTAFSEMKTVEDQSDWLEGWDAQAKSVGKKLKAPKVSEQPATIIELD